MDGRVPLLCSALFLAASCGGPNQKLPIGSPCQTSAQCGDGPFFCAKSHPGGYCKRDCKTDSDCPSDAICAFSGAIGECHKKCNGDNDCRTSEGYSCHKASAGPDDKASHAFCDVKAALAQTLFVAHEGVLASYSLTDGLERPGEVTNVTGPVDAQALSDGTIMVNLTGRNEVLVVDSATMLEKARIPSSAIGATRPVHSYISPARNGKSYWVSLNDGTDATNSSARFIDVTKDSATYLMPAGEVKLGTGHHKATFSATQQRVVFSNIADCDNVLVVYDYSDLSNIKTLATLTAMQAGWDGSSFAKTCDPTFRNGVPPAPHGCATSKVSGKAYCNLTSSGDIVVVDIDATTPAFTIVNTSGKGGGYTKATDDGKYIFSLESEPREGSTSRPGADCQIGQVVIIDATQSKVVKQVPLLYKGPSCTDKLKGTDEETVGPSHMQISHDGKTLLVTVAGGYMVATARSRQELVVDITDPANAVQSPSIAIGTSTGDHGDALSGDGAYLFVTNTVDGTVSQIDVAARNVLRTITTQANPKTVATFGGVEGPSHQTGPF